MASFDFQKYKVAQIPPPEWLTDISVQRVLSLLNTKNVSLSALIVGGAVRNTLLHADVKDVDIATYHTPQHVMSLCENAGVKTYPTGVKHGTVTAVIKGQHFEITTLRRDEETDGRHARVVHISDWREDAARRDFTMNALYMDGAGGIYDFLGDCFDDAKDGLLRFVGEPERRIKEDALRILRFFRFWSYYARQRPDKDSLKACVAHKALLDALSKERVTAEIEKICTAPRAAEIILMMADNAILVDVFDVNIRLYISKLSNVFELQNKLGCQDSVARLAMIFAVQNREIKSLFSHLVLSNAAQKYMCNLYSVLRDYSPASFDIKRLRFMVYDKGHDIVRQYLLFFHAELSDEFVNFYDYLRDFETPVFPVSGVDLQGVGFDEGREMGDALKVLKQKWIESDFSLGKKALLGHLES